MPQVIEPITESAVQSPRPAAQNWAGQWLRRLLWLNIAGLLAVSVFMRCRDLANLPGIDGDEAWYGVQAERLLHGESITWRSPTGNLLNPLFFGPQVLLHWLFEPSFALLRLPAVASGLLALAVNYWLCRRAFGRRMATVSTLILAVLPIDVAYSRFAWDACQTLLITLPAIYGPILALLEPRRRARWTAASAAALAAAIVVHPTNVFLAPVAVALLLPAWRPELAAWRRRCGATVIAVVAIAAIAVGIGWFAGPRIIAGAERFLEPVQYRQFAAGVNRLLSGATVYQYISGAVTHGSSGLAALDCIGWVVFGWLAWGFGGLRNRKRETGRGEVARLVVGRLMVGFAAALGAFYLIAGPPALAPGVERYAMWMIAPAAVLAAWGLIGWIERPGAAGKLALATAIAIGWTLLAGFQFEYFQFMQRTGGQSHRTFRTAAVEPKQAALDYILAHSPPNAETRIVAGEWWNYWPLRYLSFGGPAARRAGHIDVRQAPESDQPRWQVEFTDSPAAAAIRAEQTGRDSTVCEMIIPNAAGLPLLSIFAIAPQDPREIPAEKRPGSQFQKN